MSVIDANTSVEDVVKIYVSLLKKNNVLESRASVLWLMADILKCKPIEVLIYRHRRLKLLERQKLQTMILRCLSHEPVQYITQTAFFHQKIFFVNQHTFIPRPETEELVHLIAKEHINSECLSCFEIGTGTGCISITLKKWFSGWTCHAIDNSSKALEVAQKNAKKHHVDIKFSLQDMYQYDNMKNIQYDIIVSNPPYVMDEEWHDLEDNVLHEPKNALLCKNSSRFFDTLYGLLKQKLVSKGCCYLEINSQWVPFLKRMFLMPEWKCTIHQDMSGKNRFMVIKKMV